MDRVKEIINDTVDLIIEDKLELSIIQENSDDTTTSVYQIDNLYVSINDDNGDIEIKSILLRREDSEKDLLSLNGNGTISEYSNDTEYIYGPDSFSFEDYLDEFEYAIEQINN